MLEDSGVVRFAVKLQSKSLFKKLEDHNVLSPTASLLQMVGGGLITECVLGFKLCLTYQLLLV